MAPPISPDERGRWPPLLFTVALTIAVWIVVLWFVRLRRIRMGPAPAPRAVRGYRGHTLAAITTAVGVTWFSLWLITDPSGPAWLHSLALPAAVLFIAAGAIVAAYAGWVGGP